MKGLAIDAAIRHHNETNNTKLTRMQLAEAVYPSVSRQTAAQYISALALRDTTTASISELRKICEVTGVDMNFLFNHKPMV